MAAVLVDTSGFVSGCAEVLEALGAVGALIGADTSAFETLLPEIDVPEDADASADSCRAAKRRASSAARCSASDNGFSTAGGPILDRPDGPVGASFFEGPAGGSLISLLVGPSDTDALGPRGPAGGVETSLLTVAVALVLELDRARSEEEPSPALAPSREAPALAFLCSSNFARNSA